MGMYDRPDSDFRYPLLEVAVGGVPLGEHIGVHVTNGEFSADPEDANRIGFIITAHDFSWVNLASILRLGVFEAHENRLRFSFGWSFKGGSYRDIEGRIATIKIQLELTGLIYTLMGAADFSLREKPKLDGVSRRWPNIKIPDLVRIIAVDHYRMDPSKLVIEDVPGGPAEYNIPENETNLLMFLYQLADAASKAAAGPNKTPGLDDRYHAWFDAEGYFHFERYATAQKRRADKPALSLSWPYPDPSGPISEFSVADVEWAPIYVVGERMDDLSGDVIQAMADSTGLLTSEPEYAESEVEGDDWSPCTGSRAVFNEYIEEAASIFDVNPYVIKAVIQAETECKIQSNPNEAGACGLMQMLVATANGASAHPKAVRAYAAAGAPPLAAGPVTAQMLATDHRLAIALGTAYLSWGYDFFQSEWAKLPPNDGSIDELRVYLSGYNAGFGNAALRQRQYTSPTAISPWSKTNKRTGLAKPESEWVRGEAYHYGIKAAELVRKHAKTADVAVRITSTPKAVPHYVKSVPMTLDQFYAGYAAVARRFAEREMAGNLTILGNIQPQFADTLKLTIRPHAEPVLDWLSGNWEIREVAHSVDQSTFTTRLTVYRYWYKNREVKEAANAKAA